MMRENRMMMLSYLAHVYIERTLYIQLIAISFLREQPFNTGGRWGSGIFVWQLRKNYNHLSFAHTNKINHPPSVHKKINHH